MSHLHEQIAVEAYRFYRYRMERGVPGNAIADWFAAEKILAHGWRWIGITDVYVHDGVVTGYRLCVPESRNFCEFTS